MLYYLFVHVNKLLLVNKVAYQSYKEAFIACCQHYSYLEDYYVNLKLNTKELANSNNNNLDKIKPNPKVKVLFADFKAYA